MEKEKTGYPHIDKPWMKYYDRKLVDMPLPKMTMYEYLVEMNKKNLDMVATDFYGSKLTYGEMLCPHTKIKEDQYYAEESYRYRFICRCQRPRGRPV